MKIVRRKLGTITYAGSSVLRFAGGLPRQHVMQRVGIQFDGTLTVAGGSVNGTIVQDGLLDVAFSRIELKANGGESIKVTKGKLNYFRNQFYTGSPDVLVNPAVTAGANTCKAVVYLDMEMLRSVMDKAALLDTRRLSGLDLEITTGAATSGVVTGGDRTETLTGTYTVFAEEIVGAAGEFHTNLDKLYTLDLTGGAAGTHKIELNRGDALRSMLLLVRDNSARDNALVTNVKLVLDGVDIRVDKPFSVIQSENVREFGVELSSGAHPVTGVAIIDLDDDGRMANIIDTYSASKVELELTVGSITGTAGVDVLSQEIKVNASAGKKKSA